MYETGLSLGMHEWKRNLHVLDDSRGSCDMFGLFSKPSFLKHLVQRVHMGCFFQKQADSLNEVFPGFILSIPTRRHIQFWHVSNE